MSRHIGVAVIESRWHQAGNQIQRNSSVRGLFDLIADIWTGSHHGYDYEMAATGDALREVMLRMGANRKIAVTYLAMHGDQKGLDLHGEGSPVSRTALKNTILTIEETAGSKLQGLYLGSCLFGTQELAEFIFQQSGTLTWLAGYKREVGFVTSAALDMLFFHHWLENEHKTPRERIQATADQLYEQAGGLCNELGFSIFVRKRGSGGGSVNLLEAT